VKNRERLTIGRGDLRRIARVVAQSERGQRDTRAPAIRTADSGTEIIRGTFSGSWAKGDTKTVTHADLSAVTYEAKNYLATISPTGEMACMIASVAGEWVLAAWDWHSLPSYDSAKQQVLAHDASGGLSWLDTTDCAT